MTTETKIKCPHCGSTLLYRDEDGLACLCGWRDYGEIPEFVTTVDMSSGYSWGKYKDTGCPWATRKLRRETGDKTAQSKCTECPYPECVFRGHKPKY